MWVLCVETKENSPPKEKEQGAIALPPETPISSRGERRNMRSRKNPRKEGGTNFSLEMPWENGPCPRTWLRAWSTPIGLGLFTATQSLTSPPTLWLSEGRPTSWGPDNLGYFDCVKITSNYLTSQRWQGKAVIILM